MWQKANVFFIVSLCGCGLNRCCYWLLYESHSFFIAIEICLRIVSSWKPKKAWKKKICFNYCHIQFFNYWRKFLWLVMFGGSVEVQILLFSLLLTQVLYFAHNFAINVHSVFPVSLYPTLQLFQQIGENCGASISGDVKLLSVAFPLCYLGHCHTCIFKQKSCLVQF